MRLEHCHPLDQIFTHRDESGVVRHLNVGAITRALKAGSIPALSVVADIPPDVAHHVEANHGVEESHLKHVEGHIDQPVLMVQLEDGASILVDGNHRFTLRYRKGFKTVNVILVQSPHWQDFMVTDMPSELSEWAVHDVVESAKRKAAV